jgi:hypothetical protein
VGKAHTQWARPRVVRRGHAPLYLWADFETCYSNILGGKHCIHQYIAWQAGSLLGLVDGVAQLEEALVTGVRRRELEHA